MAQEFDSLFTSDEDHAAAATQAIEDYAYYAAQGAAAHHDDVQESLTDVITQVRDLRARIQSGIVPEKDSRKMSPIAEKGEGSMREMLVSEPT